MIVRESGAAAFVSKRSTEGAAINSAGRRIKASTERLFFTPPLSIWIWILSFCCPGKRFATGFARSVKPSPSFSGVEEISSFPSVVLASRKTSGFFARSRIVTSAKTSVDLGFFLSVIIGGWISIPDPTTPRSES